ncbi:hypothetical protein D3C87_1584870 [compost metagenome]
MQVTIAAEKFLCGKFIDQELSVQRQSFCRYSLGSYSDRYLIRTTQAALNGTIEDHGIHIAELEMIAAVEYHHFIHPQVQPRSDIGTQVMCCGIFISVTVIRKVIARYMLVRA